jgi:hypothetical protein
VIDDFDVNDIAVFHCDLLILPIIHCVIVYRRCVPIVVGISSGNCIWVIIVDETKRHSYDNIAPTNIVIPSPAQTCRLAQDDKVIAVRSGPPEVAAPPIATVLVPVPTPWIGMARKYSAMSRPLPVADLG